MSFEKQTGRDLYFAQLEKELAELIDPATGLLDGKFSQWIPCPICNGKEHEHLFIKRGYTFVRCEACDLIFTNPQVLPNVLDDVYRNEASSTELWMKVLLNQNEAKWRHEYNQSILDSLERYTSNKTLLDVGCGIGSFMDLAQNSGWEVEGLELSPTGRKHAREVLDLNVGGKTLEETAFAENSFGAISLLGVLEHTKNPLTVLSECRKIVQPGGVIVVVVPNAYSLLNMLLREKAATFDGRNHLIYFSMETLSSCFRRAGLDPIFSNTVLAGIPNITKYLQFMNPFGEDKRIQFLPSSIRTHVETPMAITQLEKAILSLDLGLRLCVVGRKSGEACV